MPYEKPDGLLLSKPAKRLTKKSTFLRKLEAKQAELAHPKAENKRVLKLLEGYAERRK